MPSLIGDGNAHVGRTAPLLPETDAFTFGQILVRRVTNGGFRLSHRNEGDRVKGVERFSDPEAALELSRFDDNGKYRPLKTAPNLRRGWVLELPNTGELWRALDHFYPGRPAVLAAQADGRLAMTDLRDTLGRQSGMYRVAATISDTQLDQVIGNFCRSDGGCLRTILWKRDAQGTVPSGQLPPQKFDPGYDQALATDGSVEGATHLPLLCQEACNLLVAECRKAVKGG